MSNVRFERLELWEPDPIVSEWFRPGENKDITHLQLTIALFEEARAAAEFQPQATRRETLHNVISIEQGFEIYTDGLSAEGVENKFTDSEAQALAVAQLDIDFDDPDEARQALAAHRREFAFQDMCEKLSEIEKVRAAIDEAYQSHDDQAGRVKEDEVFEKLIEVLHRQTEAGINNEGAISEHIRSIAYSILRDDSKKAYILAKNAAQGDFESLHPAVSRVVDLKEKGYGFSSVLPDIIVAATRFVEAEKSTVTHKAKDCLSIGRQALKFMDRENILYPLMCAQLGRAFWGKQ